MKTYELSEDYAALYDLLCEGHEVLGKQLHPETVGSKWPVWVAQDIRPLHVPQWNHLLKSGKKTFISECTRLRLQYVPPTTK
jgi:hypothetical protein